MIKKFIAWLRDLISHEVVADAPEDWHCYPGSAGCEASPWADPTIFDDAEGRD